MLINRLEEVAHYAPEPPRRNSDIVLLGQSRDAACLSARFDA
jgi:hypothetical protein